MLSTRLFDISHPSRWEYNHELSTHDFLLLGAAVVKILDALDAAEQRRAARAAQREARP